MRSFDPQKPLIFIHVPKSAGTAVKNIVTGWFPRRLHLHYHNEAQAKAPTRIAADVLADVNAPPVIYGHFNKLRGFGVEDYYPTVSQFVTILRDPLETAVSHYFYVRKQSEDWKDQSRVPVDDLETHLSQVILNALNHFPREMNLTNFKDIIDEYFIEIGITEMLPESLGRIAQKLGKNFDPTMLEVVNVTERDQDVPAAYRDRFVEKHPLDFAVYNYAKSKFAKTT
jgi:hypothetical protein